VGQYAETRRFLAGRPVGPRLTADGQSVLFLRSGPTSAIQALYAHDVKSGQTRELLTAESLLAGATQTLTPEERSALERQRVSARGFTSFQLSRDGRQVLLPLSGGLFLLEFPGGQVQALPVGSGVFDARFSPDGHKVAYVRDNDVWVLELGSLRERRLTRAGAPLITHGLAEYVAQEEMGRRTGYWWSPDGRQVAFVEADSRALEQFSLMAPPGASAQRPDAHGGRAAGHRAAVGAHRRLLRRAPEGQKSREPGCPLC
jgi:dipeptidyl-peptidase-4